MVGGTYATEISADSLIGHVVGVDVETMPVEGLPGAIGDLDSAIRCLQVARARAVARLDSSGFTKVDSGHVTATWMSNQLNRPRRDCSRDVKAARAMNDRFPILGAAILDSAGAAGDRFTLEHLHVVLKTSNRRIESALVEIQNQIIEIARNTRFSEFERHIASIGNLLDQDGSFDPKRERERSWFRISHLSTGIRLEGELFGTLAETVTVALNEIADREFRKTAAAATPDVELPNRGQLLAEALVELCRNRQVPGSTPVVEMTFLVTEPAETAQSAVSPSGTIIEDATLDMACCDAAIRTITQGTDGELLRLGRARRLATDAQRRAAHIRDKGCVFPGCDAPPNWTDLHPSSKSWSQHWRNGGTTDLANLACLCRSHHGIVHSKGWSMTRAPDGTFEFTSATGRTLTTRTPRLRTPKLEAPRAPMDVHIGPTDPCPRIRVAS